MIFIIFGIATFDGTKSITVIIAKVMSTVAYGNKNTTAVCTVSFVTHISNLIYNISVFSIAEALSDAITLVSLIIGLLKYDIIPLIQAKKDCDTVLFLFFKNRDNAPHIAKGEISQAQSIYAF